MPSTVSGTIDLVRLRVDHSALSDAQTLDVINNGMRRLQREFPIIWLEAVATGSIATVAAAALQTWTLPTDLKAPFRFYQYVATARTEVAFVDFFIAVQEYSGATNRSTPAKYSVFSSGGYLFPPLNSAILYEFYFEKFLPDFTGNTGSNAILERSPETLEYMGVAEYYDGLGESDRAESWRKKASDAVAAVIKQHQMFRDKAMGRLPDLAGSTLRRQRRVQSLLTPVQPGQEPGQGG